MGSAIMKPLTRKRGRSRTVKISNQASQDTEAQKEDHAIGDGNIEQLGNKGAAISITNKPSLTVKDSTNNQVSAFAGNARSSGDIHTVTIDSDEEPNPVETVYSSCEKKSDTKQNTTLFEKTDLPNHLLPKSPQLKDDSIVHDVEIIESTNSVGKSTSQSKIQHLHSPPNTAAINTMYGPATPSHGNRPKSVSTRSNTARPQNLKLVVPPCEADGISVEDIDLPEKSGDYQTPGCRSNVSSSVGDTDDIDLSQDARTSSPKFDDLEDVKVINPSEIKGGEAHEGCDVIVMNQTLLDADNCGAGDVVSIDTSDQPAPEKNDEQVTEMDHVIFISPSFSREKAKGATEAWGSQNRKTNPSEVGSSSRATHNVFPSSPERQQDNLSTSDKISTHQSFTRVNENKERRFPSPKCTEPVDVFQTGAKFTESADTSSFYSPGRQSPSKPGQTPEDESANYETMQSPKKGYNALCSSDMKNSPHIIDVLSKVGGECSDRKLPPIGRPPGGLGRDLLAPPLGSIIPSQNKEVSPISGKEILASSSSQSFQKPLSRPPSAKVSVSWTKSSNTENAGATRTEEIGNSQSALKIDENHSSGKECEITEKDQAQLQNDDNDLRSALERVNPEIVDCVQRQLFEEGLKPAIGSGGVSFFIPITEDGLQPATQNTDISERITKGKKASLNYEEKMMLANLNRQSHLSKLKEFAVRDLQNVRQSQTYGSSAEITSMGSDGSLSSKLEKGENGGADAPCDF